MAPIVEEGADGRLYNTAVLINRVGEVVGAARKSFPFWGEGTVPALDGVRAFDTEFGRICFAICYDINFAEVRSIVAWRLSIPAPSLGQKKEKEKRIKKEGKRKSFYGLFGHFGQVAAEEERVD